MGELDKYRNIIISLCEKHRVKSLYVFGSILTDRFRKDSDIDFIVAFDNLPIEDYADNYFDLKFSLEDTLNRSIDLLEEQAIHNPYFKNSVNQQKKLVYGYSN